MNQNRRRVMKQVITLAAAGAAGFPLAAGAAAPTVINYGGSAWLGHYSAYIAMKTGLMAKHGIDLRWQAFSTSSARMAAVMAGNVDIAGTGVVSALALMASGARQFQLIATPNNFGRAEGLLVRDGIKELADLKGKKIGVTYASSAHVLLLDVLSQAGINPDKDVAIINLPATELLTAYKANQIDAAAAWTPTFDRIRALPGTRMLFDDSAFSLYKSYKMSPGPDVLLTRSSFGKDNPAAVKGFMQAIFEANAMLTQKPEEAARVLLELTSLSMEEQLGVIKQTEWFTLADQKALMSDPGNFIVGLQKLAEMLVKLKQVDSMPQVRQWVNTTYL
ncbi:taurine ABC transporter substrate-binding protein [Herbaspirillum sp. BH-1]|uniref:Taurine transport system substrate-binding protein n=1 Tax=Herbaspirillum frisingense TaxID=92645 RepID=A0ABU1PLB9_9BURK|nr:MULTISPECIES: ABC transporter substrate-binding protein [Herbaspirillum]MDR6586718.1 taurine transport system substrate-binding protein [Herbaspirillum frisingense]PLY57398.1 taurine ABC transporter substrate-binding protein [Herbaspirillum sp. BH-1]